MTTINIKKNIRVIQQTYTFSIMSRMSQSHPASDKIIQGSRGAFILFFGNEFDLKLATNSLKVASSSMLQC